LTHEQKQVQREYMRAWYAANKATQTVKNRAWRIANAERKSAMDKAYRLANKAKIDARVVAWNAAHPERRRATANAYVRRYPAESNARTALRRARMLRRTPAWADLSAIKAVYLAAKERRLHVDHIVPLAGRFVSGLHVENNLQLLTKSANSKKNNRFADDEQVDEINITRVRDTKRGEALVCVTPRP
jgi:5-methylcytosine-specific restriction endonuclease McrA